MCSRSFENAKEHVHKTSVHSQNLEFPSTHYINPNFVSNITSVGKDVKMSSEVLDAMERSKDVRVTANVKEIRRHLL